MSSRMSLKSPICRVLAARSRCVVEAKILIKIYKYGEQNYAVFKVESERALPLLPVLLLSAYCRCCCRSVCLCWRWRRRCRFLLILLIVLLLLPLRDDEPSNTTANRMDGRGRLARERERERAQAAALCVWPAANAGRATAFAQQRDHHQAFTGERTQNDQRECERDTHADTQRATERDSGPTSQQNRPGRLALARSSRPARRCCLPNLPAVSLPPPSPTAKHTEGDTQTHHTGGWFGSSRSAFLAASVAACPQRTAISRSVESRIFSSRCLTWSLSLPAECASSPSCLPACLPACRRRRRCSQETPKHNNKAHSCPRH